MYLKIHISPLHNYSSFIYFNLIFIFYEQDINVRKFEYIYIFYTAGKKRKAKVKNTLI